VGGLREPDGIRMEGTGNLFDYDGWGITYGKEGLGEVDSVGLEFIRLAADLPPPDGQRKRDGALGGSWRNGGIVGGLWG
jgi:hypothetical protein